MYDVLPCIIALYRYYFSLMIASSECSLLTSRLQSRCSMCLVLVTAVSLLCTTNSWNCWVAHNSFYNAFSTYYLCSSKVGRRDAVKVSATLLISVLIVLPMVVVFTFFFCCRIWSWAVRIWSKKEWRQCRYIKQKHPPVAHPLFPFKRTAFASPRV